MRFGSNAALALRAVAKMTAALAAAAALASCGGGGLVEKFKPTRILAFGDELSTLAADGRKWSINTFKVANATTTPVTLDRTTLECTLNPIWTQSVATRFGLAFDRCLGSATVATGQSLAAPGAKVADFANQRGSVTGAALSHSDIALVMLGMNDLLEIYATYPTASRDAVLGAARARGEALGLQVNALAQAGTPVVVLTVPDLGLTPFALAENTSTGDATRAKLLTDLTNAFNNRMSVSLVNDGRLIGLVYADTELQTVAKFASGFGLINATTAACLATTALPGCTIDTLVTDATSLNYLWADALRPGPAFQARLGSLAAFRAVNNPF